MYRSLAVSYVSCRAIARSALPARKVSRTWLPPTLLLGHLKLFSGQKSGPPLATFSRVAGRKPKQLIYTRVDGTLKFGMYVL